MPDVIEESEKASLRVKIAAILTLALPAMTEQILHSLVGFVDILFVSRLGSIAVAGAGLANAFMSVFMAVFFAMGIAASSLITRSTGAGDLVKARGIARQSLFLSLLLGILFGVITSLFAEQALQLLGAEPAVQREGAVYLRIVGIPSIFMSLMIVAGSIIRATGDTKTPMKVSIWINLIHIPLDYLLIFGVGSFAGLGVAGAAVATVIVRALGSAVLLYSLKKSDLSVFAKWTDDHPVYRSPLTREIVKLSLPVMTERLIMRLGVIAYYSVIINIGTSAYAAHMIASNTEMVVILAGAGFEVASSILVGQYVGAKRYQEARSYAMLNLGCALLLMSLVGIALFFLAPHLAVWFSNDPAIQDMVTTALRFMAAYQPGLAMLLILTGSLQGSGDTKTPMYSTAIGMYLVRMIGIYLFAIYMDTGIFGIWLSITLDVYVRAIFLYWRFHSRFQRFERLQSPAPQAPASV